MLDAEIEQITGIKPQVSIEAIAAHPRMPEARRLYLHHFMRLYGDDRFMIRLLMEAGRFLVLHTAVLMYAAQDRARRETWCTVGSLKQQVVAHGAASERQIDILIARLRQVGFLQAVTSEQDSRVRLLLPTEKMLAHDRDWLVAHYAPLTVLYPHHDYSLIMQRDADFQLAHRRAGLPLLPFAVRVMLSVPETMLFFTRAGGHMVRSALLLAGMADPDNIHVAVPYAELADRFGISRTHVRQTLAAAEEAGLVRVMSRGGRQVELLPRLWSTYDYGLAGGMYLHDVVYRAALREQAIAA
jgi:DNA-binding MarR family transcriptional regulator